MIEVVADVAKLGIDLCIFIPSYLDQVVPVHNGSYLVLDAISLLYLLVGCDDYAFVFYLLTCSLCAVVQQ